MSGCTRELVPIPAGTTILWVQEDQFALMKCADPRQMFPNNNSGKYNCVGQQWVGDIPECIPRTTTTTATPTTTSTTTTTRPTTSTTASAQTSSGTTTSSTSGPTTGSSSPTGSTTGSTEGTTKGGGFTVCSDCKPSTTVSPGDAGMNDMSKTLLGVGLGLIAVLFLIGLSCFIYSVVSRRKKRHQEDAEVEQNLRNKRTENGNNTDGDGVDTLGKPLNTGGLLTDGRTAVWVSSGSIYGGGTYVPIPSKSDTKSENTYLSAEPLTAGHSRSSTLTSGGIRGKNSTNKEQDDQSVPDTRRLILRYSGSSSIESSPTITPPSTRSSSYLMLPPEEGASTTGYDTQGMPPFPPPPPPRPTSSFPGSDVSLTSLYGVDAGVYDGILTDLEPRYITHATADAPTKRRPSVGHCI